jgi:protein-S-isoprenylcysteine O-methyltransferase Ste14
MFEDLEQAGDNANYELAGIVLYCFVFYHFILACLSRGRFYMWISLDNMGGQAVVNGGPFASARLPNFAAAVVVCVLCPSRDGWYPDSAMARAYTRRT